MSATNSNSSTNNNEKLLKSVREQRLEEVKECLKSKCSLTYTDWAGHSSLHYASMNGNIEIASLLIRNGANINQLSKLNKIPLHFAAQNGHLDLAKLLITNGSSLNTLDILKMTPLHWAVERNYIEIARLLSSQPKKKLNTSQVDIFNRTIKVIAMKNGVKEIIELVDELMSRSELDGEDDELELAQMESRFKSSSLQKQTSIGIEPPNIDNIPGLKEFYKKKCFAKSSSSSFMSHLSLKSTNNTMPQTSGLTISGKKSIEKEATFDTESSDEDEDDNDEILEEKEIAKRKRLSMSPMNRIDDTLKWIKSQPSNDSTNFSNFQFSLTEAGKKTLDFLNKNDPIMEEKRLFLKLVKDLEDEEKSNQEKMSISAGSSPRSQDPGGVGGVHGGDLDDLLFF